MALSLNFTFGTPCAGGNHVPVTAALTGAVNQSRTVTVTRDIITTAPSSDDVQAAVEILLRLMIVQIASKTNANIKSRVEAATVNLTV